MKLYIYLLSFRRRCLVKRLGNDVLDYGECSPRVIKLENKAYNLGKRLNQLKHS